MVTLSKRQAGLFKKAQQLSQLSGATVVVLVFSPTEKPFTSSSGGNFDETIASFYGGQVPESTSQPLWWETDLSSQPTGNPFISSSGGNFDETIASFQGGQVPESKSQPLWWEADLSRIADLDQLQAYKESLLKLRENVLERIQQLQHPEM